MDGAVLHLETTDLPRLDKLSAREEVLRVGNEEVSLFVHAYLLAYMLASSNELPTSVYETVARLAFEAQLTLLQRDWQCLVNARLGSVKH